MSTVNYLIDFINTASDHEIALYLNNNNLSIIKVYDSFEKIYLVSATTMPPNDDIVETIVNDSEHKIKLLEITKTTEIDNTPLVINLDSDDDWWKTASLFNVDWEKDEQTIMRGGKGVTVYLMDSGINQDHPDFNNADIDIGWSFNDDYTDTAGHGTALASVIVGNRCGITESKLKSVKIFDQNTSTRQSDMIAALDYIITDDQSHDQVSVVNMSWSIPKNEYIESKIRELMHQGIIVLCAAGNSGHSITDVTPAGIFGVLKVGSYGQDLTPSDFSNYEDNASFLSITKNVVNIPTSIPDIMNATEIEEGEERSLTDYTFGWAPGENILCANIDGSFGFSSGTSIACAIATACLCYNISRFLVKNFEDIDVQSEYLPHDSSERDIKFQRTSRLVDKIFLRDDVITLSSEYMYAPSRVVTILNNPDDVRLFNTGEMLVAEYYNNFFKIPLYNREVYNSVTCDILPEGLNIDNGYLHGTFRSSSDNPAVTQHRINITVAGPNDKTMSYKIILTVLPTSTEDTETDIAISDVDPTLDISLLLPCCGPLLSPVVYTCVTESACISRVRSHCASRGGTVTYWCLFGSTWGLPGFGGPKNNCECVAWCTNGVRAALCR